MVVAGLCLAEPVKEVEVIPDEIKNGQRDYTVRMRPVVDDVYDDIFFECVYHQEFEWTNADGKKSQKVHEPAAFTYKRHKVKFTADLDCFISFRVPVSPERLAAIYGDTMFTPNVPITVSSIKISAFNGNKKLWQIEVPAEKGIHFPGMKLPQKQTEKLQKIRNEKAD